MKKKQNWKWEIPHTFLERRSLCFSSYKNCKLKVKLLWVRARERKKKAIFVSLILSKGIFTYQTSLPHTRLWLAFKIVECLWCILNYKKPKVEVQLYFECTFLGIWYIGLSDSASKKVFLQVPNCLKLAYSISYCKFWVGISIYLEFGVW